MFAALCTLTAGCADDFKTVLNDKYYEDDTPSREPDITEQTLTLGSYNLWISGKGTATTCGPTAARCWRSRSSKTNGTSSASKRPTERSRTSCRHSSGSQGGKYEWWFVGRDSQDGVSGEALGIAYKPRTFRADRQALLLDFSPRPTK